MEDVSLEELLNSFEKLDDLMQSMLKKSSGHEGEKNSITNEEIVGQKSSDSLICGGENAREKTSERN